MLHREIISDMGECLTASPDKIATTTTTALHELGVPCTFIAKTENPCSVKLFYAVAVSALSRLKRAVEALKIVHASVAHDITMSTDTDGVDGANIAFVLTLHDQSTFHLESATDPLGEHEYFLGVDIVDGKPIRNNLIDCPHLLVAGASGCGKSTFIHSLIASFINHNPDDNTAFVLIDLKKVEFEQYHDEKYRDYISPVIADTPHSAQRLLMYMSKLISQRYEEMQARNEKIYSGTKQVVIIDEFADLIQAAPETEKLIIRIAQLGRAAGVHLVIATQRPSVDVCTGLIKANFPCRLAFKTASKVDSRVILDTNGAETLRGKGEALFRNEIGEIKKIQCFLP